MESDHRRVGPVAVGGLGVVLGLTAVVHHAAEAASTGDFWGPLFALALDGSAALGLVYAGYRLDRADLDSRLRWRVAVWSLGGVVVFAGAVALTIAVRLFEGRAVAEPQFTLLVAAGFGGLAGSLAGYYRARAVADALRAERASDALAFVNGLVRHDLRNDIQVMHGYAAEIEDGAEADGETAELAAVVSGKAEEALERIETTGSLARTVAGDAEFEPVDLADVTADVAASVEHAASALSVETDLPERAPVRANAGVRSVVDNLVENAVEHNDADDPRVELSIERDGDRTRLVVSDNGPGIPPEDRPDPFHPGGDADGGGLRIAATLVDRYGGDLRIESPAAGPGGRTAAVADGSGGTTVVAELPRARVE